MIKKIISNQYQLEEEFKKYDRQKHFTRYDLLFNHLDSIEDFNLDIIELCCNFEEFSNIEEYNKNYSTNHKNIEELANNHFTLFDNEKDSFIVVNH
jgi:hypothetical protein